MGGNFDIDAGDEENDTNPKTYPQQMKIPNIYFIYFVSIIYFIYLYALYIYILIWDLFSIDSN